MAFLPRCRIDPSQRAEIVRHVTKLPDHLGVAEIAGSWVASAAKCDRADVALFARKRFSPHDSRVGVEAFCGLAGRHTVSPATKGSAGHDVSYKREFVMWQAFALRSSSVLLTFGLLMATIGGTRADDAAGFVQLSCTPELGLFSVRRFQVPNIPELGPYLADGWKPEVAIVRALQQKYGIYDSRSLKRTPFECRIPSLPAASGRRGEVPGFDVKVSGHVDERQRHSDSSTGSYRTMADDAEIFLNGRSLGLVPLGPYGFTVENSSIDISQQEHGLNIRKCAVSVGSIDGSQLICSDKFLENQPR